MADVVCLEFPYSTNPIGPEEVFYFVLGPDDRFGFGAVTVTAQPTGQGPDVATSGQPRTLYMEVIQVGTRREIIPPPGSGYQYFLDIVVRNNTHPGEDATSIMSFNAYVSIVAP